MEKFKFDEVIDVAKISTCATCSTFTYTLPCPIEVDFEDYVQPVTGLFQFPLAKIKTFMVSNSDIRMKSRVGRTWFEIKFKRDVENIQALFNIQVAGYVEEKNNIKIELN